MDLTTDNDSTDDNKLNVTLENVNSELKEYVRRFTASATGDTWINFKNPGILSKKKTNVAG